MLVGFFKKIRTVLFVIVLGRGVLIRSKSRNGVDTLTDGFLSEARILLILVGVVFCTRAGNLENCHELPEGIERL